jgi:CheY-like chemotaxis protein
LFGKFFKRSGAVEYMAKAKVLLIEDDPDQVYLYQTKFALEGFELISAKNGLLGLDKAARESPDFILCDIVMDDLDGLAVLKKLKSDEQTKKIPVVLLTNLSNKDLMRKSERMGAAGFWIKTEVLPQELVNRVKKILKLE